MEIPDREVRTLESSYDLLELRLEAQFKELEHGKTSTLEQAGGCPAEDLVRAMEASISRLLENRHTGLCSGAGSKTESQVALMRAKCVRLLALIERNARHCRRMQAEAEATLKSLRTGGRFLQSMRAYDHCRPRFVDAHQ